MSVLASVWQKLRLWLPITRDPTEVFWSEAAAAGGITTWLAEPEVRKYVNELVSGSCDQWPTDWFNGRFGSFGHGLSIGCGNGALERDVLTKGICQSMRAVDLSQEALRQATQLAAQAAITGVTYRRADFNRFKLPRNAFEIVFFHQSMHHVANLEHCLAQVRRALVPGGLLYADEYVGPSRSQWNKKALAEANRIFARLPQRLRRGDHIPLPIEERDPSEAIRSAEIIGQLRKRFDIIEKRDYGGNILALVYPLVRWDDIDDNNRREVLTTLIEADRRQLCNGADSYYTLIVARNPV